MADSVGPGVSWEDKLKSIEVDTDPHSPQVDNRSLSVLEQVELKLVESHTREAILEAKLAQANYELGKYRQEALLKSLALRDAELGKRRGTLVARIASRIGVSSADYTFDAETGLITKKAK